MPSAPAFTLIELLVVIAIIGVLIAAIAYAGTKLIHSQKVKYTQTIMKNLSMAIDQFATDDPLRSIYDRKDAKTFGPFPPYQLANYPFPNNSVSSFLEGNAPPNNKLSERLWRDLSGKQPALPPKNLWVGTLAGDATPTDVNDDIRALYTYLKVYSSGTLAQVPADRIKPLTATREFVNPKGAGTPPSNPNADGLLDVFGIYDAWDVPLDYFLYVKLEYVARPAGDTASGGIWRVTDRIPVLRSRGISLDEYKAEVGGTDTLDPQKYIFSAPFPAPEANGPYTGATDPARVTFQQQGILTKTNTQANGWARARATGDDYDYVPQPGESTDSGQ